MKYVENIVANVAIVAVKDYENKTNKKYITVGRGGGSTQE